MPTVTTLWSGCAAAAIMLGSVCGFVWLLDRRQLPWLMLFVLGVAAGASAYIELAMMHSSSPVEYGEWFRWHHLAGYVGLLALVLFVNGYLGAGNLWLLRLFILARSVIIVANFAFRPNFTFQAIISLRSVSFLGENISQIGIGVPRAGWQLLALGSLITFFLYVTDAVFKRWRRGNKSSRRKARVILWGIFAPSVCTALVAQPVIFGVVHLPLTNLPWFLGTLVIMAYELGRDVIRSRHAQLEAAELRAQLAQSERVNAVGRLASALAHELSQPMAASIASAEAALACLNQAEINRDELRSIIHDILASERRGMEIIARMRQLFQRRAIEMQPVGIEAVINDVVSLVRGQAASNGIVLDVQIPPGLPDASGDRVHLTQVLLNLILNAIRALESQPPDDRRIAIEARSVDQSGEIEVAVRDSGPGIPDSAMNQIFSAFFSAKRGSMGVGLALSRTIIETHGGRLWADKLTSARGATFRFTIKRAEVSAGSIQIRSFSPTGLGLPPRIASGVAGRSV